MSLRIICSSSVGVVVEYRVWLYVWRVLLIEWMIGVLSCCGFVESGWVRVSRVSFGVLCDTLLFTLFDRSIIISCRGLTRPTTIIFQLLLILSCSCASRPEDIVGMLCWGLFFLPLFFFYLCLFCYVSLCLGFSCLNFLFISGCPP